MDYSERNARAIRAKCKLLNNVLCCVSFKSLISRGELYKGPLVWGYIRVESERPFNAYLDTIKGRRVPLLHDQIEFIVKCECEESDICLGEI